MRLATMLLAVVTLSCTPCGRGVRLNRATGAYEDIVVAIHPGVEPDERIIANIKALFRSASSLLQRATGGRVHFGGVVIAVPDTWPPRPQAADGATGNLFPTADVRVAAENPQYGDKPYTLQPRGCGERGEYIHLAPRFLAEMNGSIAEAYGDPVATGNLFPTADVRVAAENPQYGDTPYTLQPRGCGERGEYIHLAPRFLAEMNGSIAEAYGDPAYRLVHEWAHYRYGVFDEHGEPGSSRYPSLYCESGTVRATMCSSQPINFTVYMDSGKPCRVYQGCRVSSQCKTLFWRESPGSEDPTASSIMSMPHFVEGVNEFCDVSQRKHDAFAPNKHNELCDRRSTWEVISANEDFTNLPRGDVEKDIHVTFREVQKQNDTLGMIVFALDISSSMRHYGRIGHLKAAASHFIEFLIPDDLEVGVVTFSTTAHTLFPLTPVSAQTRERIVSIVQGLVPNGDTCIGCALKEALKVFRQSRQRVEGSIVILLTDGKESHEPYVADVLGELISAGVRVNTIAFGKEAERKLEDLALRTGGKPFALQDGRANEAVVALESAFLDSTVALLEPDKRPIVIFEGTAKVSKEEEVAFSVLVDRDLGKGTTVTLSCDGTCALTIELRYPDGRKCDECPVTQSTAAGVYITIKIPDTATPGTWTLAVSLSPGSSEVVPVHVRATSLVVDAQVEPVLVRAFVKRTEVNVATDAVVYAEVSKGARVVLHARVTATVIRPRSPDGIEVELYDNGLGADVTANDGIYSGYFTCFDGVGRYSVSTRVVSVDHTVFVSRRMASGGQPVITLSSVSSKTFVKRSSAISTAGQVNGIPLSHFVYVDQDMEKAEPRFVSSDKAPRFIRYAEGGSFRLNADIDPYKVPPGSVQDLTVENALVKKNGAYVIFLAWTCPGSHLYWLNASHVELRVSSRPGDLVRNFTSALKIVVTAEVDNSTDGNVLAGSVGSRQRLRIHLTDALLNRVPNEPLPDLYIAAVVWNALGVSSSVSNVARITFQRPPPIAVSPLSKAMWLLATLLLICLGGSAVATVVVLTRCRVVTLAGYC